MFETGLIDGPLIESVSGKLSDSIGRYGSGEPQPL
jgi:hypothetical protein